MKIVTLITFLLIPFLLSAQADTILENDKPFFKEKADEYALWLRASGLGKILRVEKVRVRGEYLSLDLGFYTTNGDSATVLWKSLEADFIKQEMGISLEEALFNKMVYFMEIKPNKGIVQLYNSYDTRRDLHVCFKRVISYDNGKLNVKSSGCRSQIEEFTIESTNLTKLPSFRTERKAKPQTKEVVFKKIKTYVESRFGKITQKECDNRYPQIEWIDTNNELWFSVKDLCNEVLNDETNPWWCKVMSPMCTTCNNCKKRELLEMHIKYYPTQKGGYSINLQIDAKFGSGWYNQVKRGAYKSLETENKDAVVKYANKFKNDLINLLQKP